MPIVYMIETGVSKHEGEWLEEIANSQCIDVEKLVANILKDYVDRYKSETLQTQIQTLIRRRIANKHRG